MNTGDLSVNLKKRSTAKQRKSSQGASFGPDRDRLTEEASNHFSNYVTPYGHTLPTPPLLRYP